MNKDIHQDILFFFPCFFGETFYQLRFDWHLGASYILAYLKARGIKGSQFIQRNPISMSFLIERILSNLPNIIGFTCYDVNYYFVKLISKELKKRKKDLLIVAGGPTATFSDNIILRDDNGIDICVRGEGEVAVADLIDYIHGRKNIKNIQGISYRNKNVIVRNHDRPNLRGETVEEELDIFPSPYLSGILPKDGSVGILTSRGCVYHCIYCNFSAMSKWKVNYHSVDRVLDELKLISNNRNSSQSQPELVSFYDDTFSLNPKRSKEICRRIIRDKISLPLWCQTRGDCVDDELLKMMKKANFRYISFGLESAIPENLRTIKKVINKADNNSKSLTKEKNFINNIKTNIKKAKKMGIGISVSVISGLPGQTLEQAEATIDFVKELNPKYYYHDYLTIYPGTPLFKTKKNFGLDVIIPKTFLPLKTRFCFDVRNVKVLPNAIQNITLYEPLIDLGINFFTREMLISENGVGISLVFISNYSSFINYIMKNSKMRNELVISPFLCLFQKEDTKSIRKDLDLLITNEYPIINLLLLKPTELLKTTLNKKPKQYDLVFLTEVIERRRLDSQKLALFNLVQLSHIFQNKLYNTNEINDYYRSVMLIKLDNRNDINYLRKLLLNKNLLIKILKHINSECYLINQCQWSNRECPIIKENSLFIDARGINMFCFNGLNMLGHINKIQEKKSYFKANIEDQFEEAKRRRHCNTCLINQSCSKCVFTFPFSENDFCDIKREGKIHELLTIFKRHNQSLRHKRIKHFY